MASDSEDFNLNEVGAHGADDVPLNPMERLEPVFTVAQLNWRYRSTSTGGSTSSTLLPGALSGDISSGQLFRNRIHLDFPVGPSISHVCSPLPPFGSEVHPA